MKNLLIFLCYILLIFNCQRMTECNVCTSRVCKFHFVVEMRRTMTYTDPETGNTFNVALNGTKLQVIENQFHKRYRNPEVIDRFVDEEEVATGLGRPRNIITINGRFPGPTLEVLEGAEVEVTVVNRLFGDSLTIHWHGMHQVNNVWMDGVPYITMCPTIARQTFIYRFRAEPAGTHWYHSHMGAQRFDGLFGMLLVHKHLPTNPYSTLNILDWVEPDGLTYRVMDPEGIHIKGAGEFMDDLPARDYSVDGAEVQSVRYYSTLINGRGRLDYDNETFPLEKFRVSPNCAHRFHAVNSGAHFSYEISIDQHKLVVLASDGHEIRPFEVDSIQIHSGETIDFEVQTKAETTDNFWVRVVTMREGKGNPIIVDGVVNGGKAVMKYNTDEEEPSSIPRDCTVDDNCVVFNCPFRGYPDSHHRVCLTFNEAQSKYSHEYYNYNYGLDTPYNRVNELYYNWGFAVGSSINARRFVEPSGPMFGSNRDQYLTQCDEQECVDGCFCTHIKQVDINQTVQMVLTIFEPESDEHNFFHHSVHLHGTSFAVLKMGFPPYNRTSGLRQAVSDELACDTNAYCAQPSWKRGPPSDLNLIDPPIKDTIIVPAGGYAVIRFVARNPGNWFFHCHVETHFYQGMAMVIRVGEEDGFPVQPAHFPTCDHFTWTEKDFQDYEKLRDQKMNDKVETETWQASSAETAGTTTRSPDEERVDVIDPGNGLYMNHVSLKSLDLIGILIGFTLLGAVLVTIPFCYLGHQMKRDKKV